MEMFDGRLLRRIGEVSPNTSIAEGGRPSSPCVACGRSATRTATSPDNEIKFAASVAGDEEEQKYNNNRIASRARRVCMTMLTNEIGVQWVGCRRRRGEVSERRRDGCTGVPLSRLLFPFPPPCVRSFSNNKLILPSFRPSFRRERATFS